MPTGYTAIVEERDVHLREFALRCARAFGAAVHMRDEPLDAPPRPPEPRQYLREQLDRAKADRARFESMTLAQAKVLRGAEIEERERQRRLAREHSALLRSRYEALRGEVEAWRPPTAEHAGLKKLMLDQIEACRIDYEDDYEPPAPMPVKEWLAWHRRYAQEETARAEAALEKEKDHLRRQRAWFDKLYASLPPR